MRRRADNTTETARGRVRGAHRTRLLAAAFAIAFAASAGSDATAQRPRVTGIDLYLQDGVLRGTLLLADVFTEEVEGTLDSGLPAVIDLALRVQPARGGKGREIIRRITIEHDVWANVYKLLRGGTAHTFHSFDDLRAAIERVEAVDLARADHLTADEPYEIELAVAVYPLAGADDDLTGWVDEQVLGQSSRGWRERVLNVGDLVHRFFANDQGPSFRSAVFRTPPFVPSTLKKRGDRRTPVMQLALLRVGEDEAP